MIEFLVLFMLCSCVEGCIFGPGCTFPCRCTNGCDSQTGACINGGSCASSAANGDVLSQQWSGQGCQIGNVALNKITTESAPGAVGGVLISGKSVDGNSGFTNEAGHCAQIVTDPGTQAWLRIDLGDVYRIVNITVHNTNSQGSVLLDNFDILKGNDVNSLSGCGGLLGTVSQGGSVAMTCSVVVRFIEIRKKTTASVVNKMTICEVVVNAYKYININCGQCVNPGGSTCTPCTNPDNCGSDSTVFCEQCNSGYTAPICDISQCDSTSCVCTNGVCGQCQMWYLPDGTCDKHIDTLSLEVQTNPVVSSTTADSITVTFAQDDMNGVDPAVTQYYYYYIDYKLSTSSSYTLYQRVQHDSSLPVNSNGRAQRTVVIQPLSSNTEYTIQLTVVRRYDPKGWAALIGSPPTSTVSATTKCPGPSNPSGVNIVGGMQSVRISWNTLGYPSCNKPLSVSMNIGFERYVINPANLPQVDGSDTVTLSGIDPRTYNNVRLKVGYNSNIAKSSQQTFTVTVSQGTTITKITTTTITPTCPPNCVCNTQKQCLTCDKWYIPDGLCSSYIEVINIQGANTPIIKDTTMNSITISFQQVDISSLDPVVQPYYYYEVKYKKLQDNQDSGLFYLQHDVTLSVGSERTFTVTDLSGQTIYNISVSLYRRHNDKGWSETIGQLGYTVTATFVGKGDLKTDSNTGTAAGVLSALIVILLISEVITLTLYLKLRRNSPSTTSSQSNGTETNHVYYNKQTPVSTTGMVPDIVAEYQDVDGPQGVTSHVTSRGDASGPYEYLENTTLYHNVTAVSDDQQYAELSVYE